MLMIFVDFFFHSGARMGLFLGEMWFGFKKGICFFNKGMLFDP